MREGSLSGRLGGALRLFSANVYVQMLSFLSGMMVNFLFPIAFGLRAYGDFLHLVLPTLLVHRFIDGMSETLIPFLTAEEIFVGSFATSLLAAAIAVGIFFVFRAPGPDVLLLVSMLGVSSTFLTFYRAQLMRQLVGLLLLSCVIFPGLTVLDLMGLHIGMRNIMVTSNALVMIGGAVVLAPGGYLWAGPLRTLQHAARGMRRLPASLSATLMMNIVAVGFLWIASPMLSSVALAQLRIQTTIVQSSVSLFPISQRAIFVWFCEPGPEGRYLELLKAVFWLFSPALLLVLGGSALVPAARPFEFCFALAIPFCWAVYSERYLQANGRGGIFRAINLAASAATVAIAYFASSAGRSLDGYIVAVSAYSLVLSIVSLTVAHWWRTLSLILIIAAACLAAFGGQNVGVGLAWYALLVGAGAVLLPPGRSLIQFYRGRLASPARGATVS